MRTKRTIAVLAAFAALGLGSALGVAPANAASSTTSTSGTYYNCPANRFCLFSGANFNGVRAVFQNGDANLHDHVGPYMPDNTRSFVNNTSSVWHVYKNTAANRGAGWAIRPAEAWVVAGYTWDYSISSLQRG